MTQSFIDFEWRWVALTSAALVSANAVDAAKTTIPRNI
jgi:hypothetical protein